MWDSNVKLPFALAFTQMTPMFATLEMEHVLELILVFAIKIILERIVLLLFVVVFQHLRHSPVMQMVHVLEIIHALVLVIMLAAIVRLLFVMAITRHRQEFATIEMEHALELILVFAIKIILEQIVPFLCALVLQQHHPQFAAPMVLVFATTPVSVNLDFMVLLVNIMIALEADLITLVFAHPMVFAWHQITAVVTLDMKAQIVILHHLIFALEKLQIVLKFVVAKVFALQTITVPAILDLLVSNVNLQLVLACLPIIQWYVLDMELVQPEMFARVLLVIQDHYVNSFHVLVSTLQALKYVVEMVNVRHQMFAPVDQVM